MTDAPVNEWRKLWQDQKKENEDMSLDEIRRRARRFDREIRTRNSLEYGVAALVVVFFGVQVFVSPEAWARAGHGLIVAATLYIVARLRQRGSPANLPVDAGLKASLDFHRRELERQRDLVRGIWSWYLLPLVPGLAVLMVGAVVTNPANSMKVGAFSALCALLFFAVAKGNEYAARQIEREIDSLE